MEAAILHMDDKCAFLMAEKIKDKKACACLYSFCTHLNSLAPISTGLQRHWHPWLEIKNIEIHVQAEASEIVLEFRMLIADIRTVERRSQATRHWPQSHVYRSINPMAMYIIKNYQTSRLALTLLQAWTLCWWSGRSEEGHTRCLWPPKSLSQIIVGRIR